MIFHSQEWIHHKVYLRINCPETFPLYTYWFRKKIEFYTLTVNLYGLLHFDHRRSARRCPVTGRCLRRHDLIFTIRVHLFKLVPTYGERKQTSNRSLADDHPRETRTEVKLILKPLAGKMTAYEFVNTFHFNHCIISGCCSHTGEFEITPIHVCTTGLLSQTAH